MLQKPREQSRLLSRAGVVEPLTGTEGAWQGPGGPSPGTDLEATSFPPFPPLTSLTRLATPAPLNFRGRATTVTHAETRTHADQRSPPGSAGGLNALLPLLCWVLGPHRGRGFRDRKRKGGTSNRSQSMSKAESLRPIDRVRGRRFLPAGRRGSFLG